MTKMDEGELDQVPGLDKNDRRDDFHRKRKNENKHQGYDDFAKIRKVESDDERTDWEGNWEDEFEDEYEDIKDIWEE